MNLIPNIPPKAFSGSAVIVGYLLIDDLTANEQNALGNWLMLVAQVLSTNAFYKQVMTERGLDNNTNNVNNPNNNNINNNNSAFQFKSNTKNHYNNEETNTLVILEKMIKALQTEVDNIKKQI